MSESAAQTTDVDMAELARTLTPLPVEEQAAVDAARAPQETQPEAVNASDDQLERGSFLVDSTTFDINAAIKAISEEFSGSVPFIQVEGRDAEPFQYYINPVESKALDSIRAANDWENGGAYSVFNTDTMKDIMNEHAMKIHTKTDGCGRTFFHFDNGVNISLCVVVFEMKGVKMVKLNNTILSLDALLTLKRCVNVPEKQECETRKRSTPHFSGAVECTFEDGTTIVIPNISVDSMMIVTSHLSLVYVTSAPLLETVENEITEEEDQSDDGEGEGEGEDQDEIVEEHRVIEHQVDAQQKPQTSEETDDALFLLGLSVVMSGLTFGMGYLTGFRACMP